MEWNGEWTLAKSGVQIKKSMGMACGDVCTWSPVGGGLMFLVLHE